MPAPTIPATGTAASGTAAITPAYPTVVQGDLIIMVCEGNATATFATPPSGFTAHPSGTVISAGATTLAVFYRIATGSETGTVSVPDSGDHTLARMFTVRGWDVGDMFHRNATTTTAAGFTYTCPTVTTAKAQCLIVSIISSGADTAAAEFSGQSNTIPLASLTEVIDSGTTSGDGGAICVISGILNTAGSAGVTSGNSVTSAGKSYLTIAFAPALPSFLPVTNPYTPYLAM